MASNTEFRSVELALLWAEASVQLNGFVKTIKLTGRNFGMLGPDGEAYFGRESATLLTTNTEFVGDFSNPSRVYLGNPTDIEQETNGIIDQFPGSRIRYVRPGARGSLIHKNAGYHFETAVQTPTMNNPMGPIGSPEGQSASTSSYNDESQTTKEEGVKQPPNAFFRFRTSYSKMLRQKDPNMHQSAISASAKEAWKNMPKAEKQKLLDEAQADLDEFKKLHPNHFKDRAVKRKNNVRGEDQDQPKRQKASQGLPIQNPPREMAYQDPVYQMALIQPLQSIGDGNVTQAPNNNNIINSLDNDIIQAPNNNVIQTLDNEAVQAPNNNIAQSLDDNTVKAPGDNVAQLQYEQLDGAGNVNATPIGGDEPSSGQENEKALAPVEGPSFVPDGITGDFSFEDLLNFDCNFEDDFEYNFEYNFTGENNYDGTN
ncbi:hypothetical protein F5X98DRAFT_369145 [Xylaria grammica]|nr:hypothetical protein F5X98DRAFT_369145 [Xylaria grammica]